MAANDYYSTLGLSKSASPDEIKKVREATAGRNKPWTKEELEKGKK